MDPYLIFFLVLVGVVIFSLVVFAIIGSRKEKKRGEERGSYIEDISWSKHGWKGRSNVLKSPGQQFRLDDETVYTVVGVDDEWVHISPMTIQIIGTTESKITLVEPVPVPKTQHRFFIGESVFRSPIYFSQIYVDGGRATTDQLTKLLSPGSRVVVGGSFYMIRDIDNGSVIQLYPLGTAQPPHGLLEIQ